MYVGLSISAVAGKGDRRSCSAASIPKGAETELFREPEYFAVYLLASPDPEWDCVFVSLGELSVQYHIEPSARSLHSPDYPFRSIVACVRVAHSILFVRNLRLGEATQRTKFVRSWIFVFHLLFFVFSIFTSFVPSLVHHLSEPDFCQHSFRRCTRTRSRRDEMGIRTDCTDAVNAFCAGLITNNTFNGINYEWIMRNPLTKAHSFFAGWLCSSRFWFCAEVQSVTY